MPQTGHAGIVLDVMCEFYRFMGRILGYFMAFIFL